MIPVPAQAVPGQAPQGLVRYQLCGRDFDGVQGAAAWTRGVLIARPEELALMAPAPYVPNTPPGKVLRRQYLGFKTAYRIALEDGSGTPRRTARGQYGRPVPARRGRAGADPRRQPVVNA